MSGDCCNTRSETTTAFPVGNPQAVASPASLVREDDGPRRYCGLARDPEAKAPACGACGSDDSNWLRVLADKKQEVPWIQMKTLTPEEAAQRKQAEVAAKRAEVEANVRKALAERSKS